MTHQPGVYVPLRALFLVLNMKFQASNHLLWLYNLVCVRPGRKPRRLVFSQRGSNLTEHLPSLITTFVASCVDRIISLVSIKRKFTTLVGL